MCGRGVVLQRARVEFLLPSAIGDREHIAARAFADEAAQAFEPRIFAAEMEIQTQGRGIALDGRGVDLQCEHVLAPVLRADVVDLRARPGDEIVHPAGETARGLVERAEMFDHGDLRHLVRDQKQMRKDRGIFIVPANGKFRSATRFRRRAAHK